MVLFRVLACLVLASVGFSAQKKKAAPARKRVAQAKPVDPVEAQVNRWMRTLTLRDRVAQLVILPFYGDNPPSKSKLYRKYSNDVRLLRVGGLVLVNRVVNGLAQNADPIETARFLNRMQGLARVPLIVAGDFERGASMRIAGMVKYPHSMAFAATGEPGFTRQLGAATAREARLLGFHWIFAPVADVNDNPDNPIINIRAFSESPAEVATHVKAFLEGASSNPEHKVLLTVKHFPGHGDTVTDSHMGLGKVEASLERLKEVELVPFRAAIDAGVQSVMTAHLWVAAIDERELPATVSHSVLTDLLREQLGFRGLTTTDAMDMYGLSRQFPAGEAAVRAIQAGADVLLMPPDANVAIRAVVQAVAKKRLSAKRIDESVRKLLRAKAELGLAKEKLVPIASIEKNLQKPEEQKLAQQVAERAVTLVRNQGNLVPVKKPESSCWFLFVENSKGKQGERLLEMLSEMKAPPRSAVLHSGSSDDDVEQATKLASSCDVNVFAAYAGFRRSESLPSAMTQFLAGLDETKRPWILVGMGSPYLVRDIPDVAAYLASFSTVPASEEAVVRAVYGQIPITGKLVVTIPGIAEYGATRRSARRPGGPPALRYVDSTTHRSIN